MVDDSLAHAMVAPSDPFSLKLQEHTSSNPSPKLNINQWGTWEELLLGSAVLKHGAENWALVSAELQSRARRSFSFTPEACKAGYQAIKLRFGADGGREGDSAANWYEELRRLRVADLKWELEQCDNSIGSLQNKIKRLESATGKRAIFGSEAQEFMEACEPTLMVVAAKSIACVRAKSSVPEPAMIESTCETALKDVVADESYTEKPCHHMAKALGDAMEPKDSVAIDQSTPSGTMVLPMLGLAQLDTLHTDGINLVVETPTFAMGAPPSSSSGVEEQVLDEALASLSQQGNDGRPEEEQPSSYSSILSKSDGTTLKSTIVDHNDIHLHAKPRRYLVQTEQEVGGRAVEVLARSHDTVDGNCMAAVKGLECNNCTISNEMLKIDGGGQSPKVRHLALCSQVDVSFNLGDTLQGDLSAKQGVLVSLKSVNIEESATLASGRTTVHVNDSSRKSEESESLYSPRLNTLLANKCRRSSSSLGREACLPDDVDAKCMVLKAVGEKNLSSSLAVESADSTDGKGQEALAAKTLGPEPLNTKVKKEILTCKEDDNIMLGSSAAKVEGGEHSRRLSGEILNVDTRNKSPSSTENSLIHEVWGESVKAINKEINHAKKRQWHDRKRKATTFNTMGIKDVCIAREPPVQVECATIKVESMTDSHESSESMHFSLERLSGDSRFERSEVGSYVDDNEDTSRINRRHQRESKVCGKLIPLLKSLRTICTHNCAPFFRQNQEANWMYYHMVRMPIDLGIIRTKLEEGQYSGSMHFFRDLLLMVSNALVYYSRDSSEFAAASGLHECVMKEMGHVFETELLVKREGPSFRRRDTRQLAMANQGRRKGGLKLLPAMDKPYRGLGMKQPNVSAGVESHHHSNQNLASRSDDRARGVDVEKHADSPEGRRSYDNPEGLRLGPRHLVKANAMEELGLKFVSTVEKANEGKGLRSDGSSINTLSKDAKFKHRLSENGVGKKGEYVKVESTSKASASLAPIKSIGNSGSKLKAFPDVVNEPMKRGVGRPPKRSQQHGLQKAREIDFTQKRARR